MENVIFKIEANKEQTGLTMECSAGFAVQSVVIAMSDLAAQIYERDGEKQCMYFIEQLEKNLSAKRMWDNMEKISGRKRESFLSRVKDLFK